METPKLRRHDREDSGIMDYSTVKKDICKIKMQSTSSLEINIKLVVSLYILGKLLLLVLAILFKLSVKLILVVVYNSY